MRILPDGSPSWRQRRRPQFSDQPQDFLKQAPWDRYLGQLEGDIPKRDALDIAYLLRGFWSVPSQSAMPAHPLSR